MTVKGEKVKCQNCGEVFVSTWNDEDALEEMQKSIFAETPIEQIAVVCDDCYNSIVASLN